METLRVLPALAGGGSAVWSGSGLGSFLAQLGKGRFPPAQGQAACEAPRRSEGNWPPPLTAFTFFM